MAEERERERITAEIRAARGDGPDDDLPHVIITDDPAHEQKSWSSGVERGWYEPESGDCSVDSGRIRIGDHAGRRLLVRAVNGGREAEEPTRQHKPDPDGLKGGKD